MKSIHVEAWYWKIVYKWLVTIKFQIFDKHLVSVERLRKAALSAGIVSFPQSSYFQSYFRFQIKLVWTSWQGQLSRPRRGSIWPTQTNRSFGTSWRTVMTGRSVSELDYLLLLSHLCNPSCTKLSWQELRPLIRITKCGRRSLTSLTTRLAITLMLIRAENFSKG